MLCCLVNFPQPPSRLLRRAGGVRSLISKKVTCYVTLFEVKVTAILRWPDRQRGTRQNVQQACEEGRSYRPLIDWLSTARSYWRREWYRHRMVPSLLCDLTVSEQRDYCSLCNSWLIYWLDWLERPFHWGWYQNIVDHVFYSVNSIRNNLFYNGIAWENSIIKIIAGMSRFLPKKLQPL